MAHKTGDKITVKGQPASKLADNNFAEYIPFGDEWKREMHKFPKEMLINQLRDALMELQQLKTKPVI